VRVQRGGLAGRKRRGDRQPHLAVTRPTEIAALGCGPVRSVKSKIEPDLIIYWGAIRPRSSAALHEIHDHAEREVCPERTRDARWCSWTSAKRSA
jgi:hypothetical protein